MSLGQITEDKSQTSRSNFARTCFSLVVFGLVLFLLNRASILPAHSSPDDRTITSITTSPDNTFDNQLFTAGTDSGVYVELVVSGAAPGAEAADNQGGYRIEYYNPSGTLIRRRTSAEVNASPTGRLRWNGQGDSTINDTQVYGSYTLRAYMSMRDPTVAATIEGSGIVIDRPGDLHVTSGGILSWTNTGNRISFCQVSLGDPNTSAPTFLRLVDLPTAIQGTNNTDANYGIVMDSKDSVYVTGETVAGVTIAKYSTTAETWVNLYWAGQGTTTIGDDDWLGLTIDSIDSVSVAAARGVVTGMGPGGTYEGVIRFRDNGATATQDTFTKDRNTDYYDAAAGTHRFIVMDYQSGQIDTAVKVAMNATVPASLFTIPGSGGNEGRSIWQASDSSIYFADNLRDSFSKYTAAGNLVYSITDVELDGASGIAVWQKASTNETFVIIGAQTANTISIYKENAAGTNATFVRAIEDDDYNLNTPVGIAVAADSAVFVVNRGSNTVKKFSKDGVFQSLAGAANGKYISGTDGSGANLTDTMGFNTPGAIAVDGDGNIYVFDQVSGFVGAACIKRFSANGAPDGTVWYDLDANVPGAAWSGEITSAVYSNGYIYASSRENDARLFRIATSDKTATWMGGASAPVVLGRDVLGLTLGPFYDSSQRHFYPEAVYIYTDQDRFRIYRNDFGLELDSEVRPGNPAPATALNVTQPVLVDNAGEIYTMIDDGSATYSFLRHNAADTETALGTNGLLQYDFTQGNGASQLDAPRQMVWTDNAGVFTLNPVTERYEQKIWVNDSVNSRLKQLLIAWNDVKTATIVIALSQDTAEVISATVTGETDASIAGVDYVGLGICTVQVNFNHQMVTTAAPDTMVVQIKPSGGSFTNVTKSSYNGTTWIGTVSITSGMSDGNAIVKVEDAYDSSGTVRFLDPNPDQTDFDGSDNFAPFVIDKTAPAFSVADPASGGDTVSDPTYTVTGQVTDEATGLDATIQVINWTALTGGTQIDSKSTSGSVGDGTFERVINLKSPSPSDNYIEVIATDDLGNYTTLSPRRLVKRVKDVGSNYITTGGGSSAAPETTVNTLGRYVVVYTAGQTLAGDTLKLTIPTYWSAPQNSNPSTNGYVTITESSAYTDSQFSGQVVTIRNVTLGLGQTMHISYGDSAASMTGRAKASSDAPLDDASNTFRMDLQQQGETTFTEVGVTAGSSRIVQLKDSNATVALSETQPRTGIGLVAKGEETKVLVTRVYNSNVGNHTNRVSSVILSAQTDTGGAAPWNNLASRVVVKNTDEGVTFADVSTMPSNSNITLTLSNFTVSQGSSRDMEIWVTFSTTTTIDTAQFYFSGVSAITMSDSSSGKSLTVLSQETGVTSALKTGEFDIIGLLPADTLSVSADTSITPSDAATGQVDVNMLDILLKNEPLDTANPVNSIRVDQIVLTIRDTSGAALVPASVLKGIHIRDASAGTQYGGVDTPSLPTTGDTVTISLSGLYVGSDATVTARVWVDIANDTLALAANNFRIRLSDTNAITAKDKILNTSLDTIRDDPATSAQIPFQTSPLPVQKKARAGIASITFLKTDSSATTTILAGDQFFVAVRCTNAPGGSSLRVVPSDTDLKLAIGGSNITSEFTIVAPSGRTIAAGAEDTITYSCVQNLGSSTGIVTVQMSDTATDTRARFFDNHQYTGASQLRATFTLPSRTKQLTINASPFDISAYTLDTTYANSGETAVPILHFSVKNNQGSNRTIDSVVVEAISADSAIKQVRLYHDNRNSIFQRSDSATPIAGLDTLVATGTLAVSDSAVTLILSPVVTIGTTSTESFYVAFDFDNTVTDGDTFDARVPALGIHASQEAFAPAAALTSGGTGRLEVVATRVTATPDTKITSASQTENVVLKAVDAYGNIDNVVNYETSTQGHNIQVQVTVSDAIPATDTNFSITATSGMSNVTPTPARTGISAINGNLASGQGQVSIRDTSAETVAITISSTLLDSSAAIQYAQLITVSAVNLSNADSAAPDSRAFNVAKFRVVNQSGMNDQVVTVGVRSLNTNDSHVSAVILFRDDNGNAEIDSGTDATIGTTLFTSGFATFDFLTADVLDQDSELFMIGYNVSTEISDAATLDARIDSVVINSSSANIANQLNSTPDRRVDVKVLKLAHTPSSGTTGTGASLTVTAKAVDAYGNTDIHYNGQTGITWDLTGSATFTSSTLASEDIDPPPDPPYDYTQIKGKLVSGQADLTFTDNTAETPVISVTASPGVPGTNDTGSYVFEQGYLATALNADQKIVDPGDVNVVLLAFKVSATGVSDSISSITINWQSADSGNVRNVRIYRDLDANDTFSAVSDTPYGTARSFIGDVDTFVAVYTNDTPYIANGTNKSFFVVADIADTAVGTDTLDVQLPAGSITTSANIQNVPTGIRNSSGYCTVARVPDTFRVGLVTTTNRSASEDQTEIIPMTLRFSSPSAADRKFYVESFAIMVEGLSGGKVPNTVIQRARLRNQSSGTVYQDKTSIESSGDSMVFSIPYNAANPMQVGGTSPETITVDVVLTIASSVTNNDTFRLRVNAVDTPWAKVFDHPLATLGFSKQKNNILMLNGASLPLTGSIVTVQKQAQVTQTAIRITDLSDVDIDTTSLGIGEQFKVHVGLAASSGRAGAMVQSSDTDLTFKRGDASIDISSEFVMVSRSHTTLTDISAGSSDTIEYTLVQGNPNFSGGGESLVINNYLASDTGPYLIDKNSQSDATKLRIYAVENSLSKDTVQLDTAFVTVLAVSLSNNDIAPDSRGVRVMSLRLTDVAGADKITGITVHLLNASAASMIKSCWISLDTNRNGLFDTGVDSTFGQIRDFKSSDTVYFTGMYWQMKGSGDTLEANLILNMETGPITDSTFLQVEATVNGIGIEGKDSIPKTVLVSDGYFKTRVVATKIVVTPKTQSLSTGASAVWTIRSEDTWGNLNVVTTNFSQVTVNSRIYDTWSPTSDKSARWTATTYNNQAPASLPSGAYYDSYVSGKLVSGQATATMTDSQAETVAIAFTTSSIPGETVVVGFSNTPSVTVVALSALMKVSPDSTDAQILVLDVSFPGTGSTVDSIYLRSENTADTAMKRLRLWVDSDASGSFSSTSDSNVDTAAWSSGACSFLVNRNYFKAASVSTIRFFVTAHMETGPQVDNDSIGARIDTAGIRLSPGGNFPPTGELDSLSSDTQNAVIDIDAIQTGGSVRFIDPGTQSNGAAFTMTIRAEDKYGNLDRVFTTLGSSAGRNVTFSASPAGFTFNSTSMTSVSGWPGATPVARFKNGSDTVNITPNQTGTITATADVATSPPSDTTIDIVVTSIVSGGIVADSYALTSDTFASGATNVILASFYVQNGKASNDSVQTITLKNHGSHPDTGITNIRIMIDGNANGAFDGIGVDTPFGASGGAYAAGSLARTDSALVTSGNTTRFLVLANLSATLAVDSQTLRARIDSSGMAMFSGDIICTRALISNGVTRTGVIFDPSVPGALDSVAITGGTGIADNSDTGAVSVSVRDTNGVPAAGRVVWLTGDTGAPVTVVTSNPLTTGQDGVVNFSIRTGTANTYNYQATVNGVTASPTAQVIMIAPSASGGGNLGGNPTSNTQQTVVTGTTKTFIGNVAFGGSGNPNTMVYIKADGTNWQLVKQDVGGAPTALLSKNAAAGSESGQVSFAASTAIRNTATTMGTMEHALVGVIHRANGRRPQIYAVNLATGDSVRITPNDPFDPNNGPMPDNAFRWFDMNPAGDKVVSSLDGNLLTFDRSGATWNNTNDSATFKYLTAFANGWGMTGAAGNTEVYAAYPQWSPDGTRIAFTAVYVSDALPSGPAVDRADIYVLHDFDTVTLGTYPNNPFIATLQNISDTNFFTKVTSNQQFAYFPRWTRDGSGLVYSVATGPSWDWQNIFTGYPEDNGMYDVSGFVTRFIYYDKNTETAPYSAIDVSTDTAASGGSLDVVMQQSGSQRFAYVKKSMAGANRVYELRTVDLSSEATVTSQGGVLFDSGRIIVVVPSSESYGAGFKIGGTVPESTPPSSDSIIITGAGKEFFAPGQETAGFYFADTITIIIYYSAEDFTDTEKQGYDSDGDGIPDRTEAALSVYYYNGTQWDDYKAVRYPAENKLEFRTRHFSHYAAGIPMEARALAFSGSVANVIAYPNPWRSDGPTASLAPTDERYGIKLTRMPGPDVRVKIFTLAGELVVDATVNALNGTSTNSQLRVTAAILNDGDNLGTVSWNLKNQSGRDVASGVYLIVLEGPGGRSVRKVAVMR
ncbi:MAG: hypothetical protein AAB229_08500 [Candidatus Hydrogenedentota bacterium]